MTKDRAAPTPAPDADPALIAEIDALSHLQMARIWRFARSDFRLLTGIEGTYFVARFSWLGGMTTTMSKSIGWGAD